MWFLCISNSVVSFAFGISTPVRCCLLLWDRYIGLALLLGYGLVGLRPFVDASGSGRDKMYVKGWDEKDLKFQALLSSNNIMTINIVKLVIFKNEIFYF